MEMTLKWTDLKLSQQSTDGRNSKNYMRKMNFNAQIGLHIYH